MRPQSYAAQLLGTCDNQEDRYIRVGSLAALCSGEGGSDETDYLVGVYDGHGGDEASEYCHSRLFWEVGGRGKDCDVSEALKHAYRITDAQFNEAAERDELNAGCTALTVLVRGDTLWVANAGDSRAVLYTGGKAIALSTDHNVRNPQEVQAVIDRGGKILRKRVNGVLCVTRALGNRMCRDLIGQVPDIASRKVDTWSADDFVVLGSDGLFDHLTNEDICARICASRAEREEKLNSLRLAHPINASPPSPQLDPSVAGEYLACTYQRCADDLVKVCVVFLHAHTRTHTHTHTHTQYAESKAAGYCDNTTCVVLFLNPANGITPLELVEAARVARRCATPLHPTCPHAAHTQPATATLP